MGCFQPGTEDFMVLIEDLILLIIILRNRMLSLLVQILKGKGDPLNPKIRICFLYLLTWKRLLIWCQGKLCFTLRQKGVRIFGKRL